MSCLRIRHAVPADRAGVVDLLRGLSPESAYRRFQTVLGHGPGEAMLDALLPTGPAGGAVLAFVGAALAGHGVWHRTVGSSVAEIGVVVADAHQRQGIGSALAEVLVSEVVARGFEQVEVFATATNEPVMRMVTRQARDAVREYDRGTVTYRFPAQRHPAVRTVA